jgi:hypothetical protein
VTLEVARRHLGVETRRQWSEPAIQRTTPTLLGLFSLVTLIADGRLRQRSDRPRQVAWYTKEHATFADALALVRADLWVHLTFYLSSSEYRQGDSAARYGAAPDRHAVLCRLSG